MKKSINLKIIAESISRFFERFHTIIFFLLLGIGLIISLVILVTILNRSGVVNSSEATHINQQFDENTIERIKNLDDNSGNVTLPNGRTNPFVE